MLPGNMTTIANSDIILDVTTIFNSSFYCVNSNLLTLEICHQLQTHLCEILAINENICYKQICLCSAQQYSATSTVKLLVQHTAQVHNLSVWSDWIKSIEVVKDEDDLDFPFLIIFASFAMASIGLFIVLCSITLYHKYVGYKPIGKQSAGVDCTTECLIDNATKL
jgi:hypothetical protein